MRSTELERPIPRANSMEKMSLPLLVLVPKEVTQNTTAQVLSQKWVTVLKFLGMAALEHKQTHISATARGKECSRLNSADVHFPIINMS